MSIALSSIGTKVEYGAATQAAGLYTAPVSFTEIKGITEVPEINPAPETIEVTSLSSTEYKEYIDGLKDLGGAITFNANLTDDFVETWQEVVNLEDLACIRISIDGLEKVLHIFGKASPLGAPGLTPNSAVTIGAHFVPLTAPRWV